MWGVEGGASRERESGLSGEAAASVQGWKAGWRLRVRAFRQEGGHWEHLGIYLLVSPCLGY